MVQRTVFYKSAVAAGAAAGVITAPVGNVHSVHVAFTPSAAADKGVLAIKDVQSDQAILTLNPGAGGVFHPRGDALHTVAGAPIASTNVAPVSLGRISVDLSSASDVTAIEVTFVIEA